MRSFIANKEPVCLRLAKIVSTQLLEEAISLLSPINADSNSNLLRSKSGGPIEFDSIGGFLFLKCFCEVGCDGTFPLSDN